MPPLKPKPLRQGDLIGLISPASPIADTSRIARGVRYLESLGYRTVVGKCAERAHGYLAGSDEERVAEIHAMFGDKSVRAVMCIRGGYGTPRILSRIDYRLIAQHPKIFVGYSDITGLQLAIWRKAGLLTFHGPMVGVDLADAMDPFTEELFWRLLTSREKAGRIVQAGETARTAVPGKGTGRLLGGNLSLVVSLLGTAYQPEFRRSILFLEDIDEEPYRIDRMLAQLRNASLLSTVRVILTGQFTDCTPKDPTKPSLSVDQVLDEYLRGARRPALVGLPFGHATPKMTIPIGIRARADADARSLEFLESAVQ